MPDHDVDDGHAPDGASKAPRVGHDLSNLLLAVRLRVDVLRIEKDPTARRKHLDAIEECVAQAIVIVRSLRDE